MDERSSTFIKNMSLPVHRWFRYSAGFSGEWVAKVIKDESSGSTLNILDPFVGSGTVCLEASFQGVDAFGVESHPFVARIARTKLLWTHDPNKFYEFAHRVYSDAMDINDEITHYPELIRKCYLDEQLGKLDRLRRAYLENDDQTPSAELTWLVLVSILRKTSHVGTASWQYILPKKRKARMIDAYEAYLQKASQMKEDMLEKQTPSLERYLGSKQKDGAHRVEIFEEDARTCESVPDDWADLIITSPPYANNYDYADATRLEMSFLGEVQRWGDLHEAVRQYLVRSCTQHVSREPDRTYEIINDPLLSPIHDELLPVCQKLEKERHSHGGKKVYYAMVAAYFYDLAKVWHALRRVSRTGCRVCFVVGDSAPYGIHVPVDKWLGELAVSAGFESYAFEKIRDRNVRWKNRKHRVRLHEGRLWIEG